MADKSVTQLQTLLDRQAIEHILTTYPRAIDRLDLDLLKSLYHPDARDSHAVFEGTAYEFAEHIIEFLRDMFTSTMHHVTHSNIEVHGDIAAAESYYDAYHLLEGDFDKVAGYFGSTYAERCRNEGTIDAGHEFLCGGRYIDIFTRCRGEWRIAEREITVEWKHFRPVTRGDSGSGIERVVAPAGRDLDDVAYRFFTRAGKARIV
ncbi:nuclear transport factor 2 family protein [Noviherbaspirillum sedimenti]|uniref:Nuclear transport factor 2 family protein n=1 Tax=Noviherbaspirillum sedimenti TaxID=2320865 RepID=A0A3A3FYX9_9BURK|nr:nuclear transport factor 2 family protein [Noviherbaspirillum sedimenti]RJG01363.1 nuclear transport factor 2 family protein [Noviherbaspirillum sedimenti]